MDIATGPGPEREKTALSVAESDAFLLLVDASTYEGNRSQVSFVLQSLRAVPPKAVIDGIQRCARRMWKTAL